MMKGLRFPAAQASQMIPYPELSGEELDGVAKILADEETDTKSRLTAQ